MNTNVEHRPRSVSILIFLHIFLGLNGLLGGGAFLIAPDGRLIQMPMSQLKYTPFPDFLIPGLLLFSFLGVFPIVVAYCLGKRPSWRWPDALNPFKAQHWAWAASLAAGVIAVIWIIVQIQWIQVGWLHAFIFAWGILIMIVTMIPGVRKYFQNAGRSAGAAPGAG